jgi:hypothetical protein
MDACEYQHNGRYRYKTTNNRLNRHMVWINTICTTIYIHHSRHGTTYSNPIAYRTEEMDRNQRIAAIRDKGIDSISNRYKMASVPRAAASTTSTNRGSTGCPNRNKTLSADAYASLSRTQRKLMRMMGLIR